VTLLHPVRGRRAAPRRIAGLPVALGALTVVLAACGAPAGESSRPAAQGQTPGSGHFTGGGLSFDYPATWYAATYPVVSSFSTVQVFLSTVPLSDPCLRTSTSISCERSAVDSLGADGALVTWVHWGFPGRTFDPANGDPATVGGRRATLEWSSASPSCAAIGGERELLVTIESRAEWNWDELQACLRGPAFERLDQEIEAMLDSVRWGG
jgi:hypothetical protein